jgi:hypothetical protein
MKMTTETNPIIAKIQKLMALANHASTNVNEAATAAARAQALLFEHKISMIDLEASTGTAPERVGQLNVDGKGKGLVAWQSQLMNAIAYGFYCRLVTTKVVVDGKLVSRMCVIGKPSDTQTVAYMFSYLKNEIDRLCDIDGKNMGGLFRNSFRFGAVAELQRRMKEQRMKQEAGTVTGTALAIIKSGDADLAAYVKSQWSRVTSSKANVKVTRRDAYQAGATAARDIHLGTGPALGAGAKQLRRA